jgi:hypothetical protein
MSERSWRADACWKGVRVVATRSYTVIGYAYAVVDTAKSPAHLLVSQSLTFWGFVVTVMRWNNVVRGWNTPTSAHTHSPSHSHTLSLTHPHFNRVACSHTLHHSAACRYVLRSLCA